MRTLIDNLPGSLIREVANAGLGRDDVLPFWFGESDEITPPSVRAAAIASIERGETMYSHNLGMLELRTAIAGYVSSLHPALSVERIAVTSSGVNALMIAMQLLVDAGDEVVAVIPVWPNLTAQPAILGAKVKRVSLVVRDGAWQLDLPALLEAVTDRTRVLIVNAPNNPTGWTMSRAEQQMVLDHCRRTGTWIVADEVYERLYFGPGGGAGAAPGTAAAPSFLDIATPEDRLVVAQSFSKSFLMTGWRLGYMVVPESVLPAVGKLIEFNTSCAPVFVQRAGLQALQEAAQAVPALVAKLQRCRDTLLPQLMALDGVEVAVPQGGMYAFFRLAGENDSLALAKRLVVEAGLGLAPGAAFGSEAEGWLRWCFASRDPARLTQGVERLAGAIRR
ncbi:MAG: aminotransferase [Rhizobacter sp.]|nr:aminotransferase [Rhizobacter sp.]